VSAAEMLCPVDRGEPRETAWSEAAVSLLIRAVLSDQPRMIGGVGRDAGAGRRATQAVESSLGSPLGATGTNRAGLADPACPA